MEAKRAKTKPPCGTGINNRKLTNLMGAESMEQQQGGGALSRSEIISASDGRQGVCKPGIRTSWVIQLPGAISSQLHSIKLILTVQLSCLTA